MSRSVAGKVATAFNLLLFPTIFSPVSSAQYVEARVRSEHVRMKISMEREWLGRETIVDLEQCWKYVNGVTGKKLPRIVIVEVNWEAADSRADPNESSISIGMNQRAASANTKDFLLRQAAREMAILGLAELSRGATLRDENAFLAESMAEILAREFDLSTKALTAAWLLAHFLDRVKPLSLEAMSSRSSFTGAPRNLTGAAPGISFLVNCRERYGRDSTLKLFETLKKSSLKDALSSTFKESAAVLEEAWLKKIRNFPIPEDLTITSEEDAPQLRETVLAPSTVRRGASLQLRMFIQNGRNNLTPSSVFVLEKTTGLVLPGKTLTEKDARFTLVEIPIEETRPPGTYQYRATAVDQSGNIRNWEGAYTVVP